MKTPISEVTNVETSIRGNVLRIEARGEVPTTGWSGGELRLDNGFDEETLVFTFVATPPPPEAIVQPLFTPIEAEPFEIPLMPIVRARYVIVRAADNDIRVAAGKQLVYEVTSGKATASGTILAVSAKGMAPYSGWSDAELVLQSGGYEYWFMARPGGAMPVLTEIEAGPEETLIRPPFPDHVTIKSATNALDVRIDAAEKEAIAQVEAAHASLDFNMLHVEAHGITETGGWTNPELRLLSDGATYVLEFVATRPQGPVSQVITPIAVKATFGPLEPPFPENVTVRSASNEVTVPVQPAIEAARTASKVRIYRADAVQAKQLGNAIHIEAKGTVTSSGWKEPELRFVRRVGKDTLVYAFIARRPTGITNPVLEEIHAETTSDPEMPPFLTTYVVVQSETNTIRTKVRFDAPAPEPRPRQKQATA